MQGSSFTNAKQVFCRRVEFANQQVFVQQDDSGIKTIQYAACRSCTLVWWFRLRRRGAAGGYRPITLCCT